MPRGYHKVSEYGRVVLPFTVLRRLDLMLPLDETSLTAAERDAVERFIARLEEELGEDLDSVWLYGSKARGEHGQDSDVDLLVIAEGGRERHRRTVLRLAHETESLDGQERVVISPAVEDREGVAERRRIEDFFMRDVDRDKVVLLGAP